MIEKTQKRDRPSGSRSRMWGATLLIVATALYMAAVAGSLYTLETAYYIPEKWDLIKEQIGKRQYINFEKAGEATVVLKSYARALHFGYSDEAKEELRQQSLEKMRGLLASSPTVTAVHLEDAEGNVIISVEDRSRLKTQHDFSNSLLTRNFERSTHTTFTTDPPEQEVFARFKIYVTTEKNHAEIETLTTRYRWWMIGLIGSFTLIYYLLLRLVLIPLSRVLTYMQTKRSGGSPIIPSPRSELERAYNNLARDATLTRFSVELREYISREGLSHIEPILNHVPALVLQISDIEGCQIWFFSRPSRTLPWTCDRAINRQYPGYDADAFLSEIQTRLSENDPFGEPGKWIKQVVKQQYFSDILSCTEERLLLLVIQLGSSRKPGNSWWADFYSRIAQELRYAISTIEEQRRMILQEKSKANISLSRNLGHDLTNIIATSKLELMTVRAFLSLNAEQVKESPRKEKLFKESLEALLNNTRFLQEIVNLYRSFSYLQKPKFEEVDISELIEDVSELYKLSVSNTIRIETDLQDSMPAAHVEPRLLRLALFNLLTNAADSIKRATSADTPEGSITIDAVFDASHNRIGITVSDTGLGICDEQGNLLSAESLNDIFRLGFSTKANQEGEGLGLNWVQTIVREFHGGEINAANRSEGGAAFTIRIPVKHAEEKGLQEKKDTLAVKNAAEKIPQQV